MGRANAGTNMLKTSAYAVFVLCLVDAPVVAIVRVVFTSAICVAYCNLQVCLCVLKIYLTWFAHGESLLDCYFGLWLHQHCCHCLQGVPMTTPLAMQIVAALLLHHFVMQPLMHTATLVRVSGLMHWDINGFGVAVPQLVQITNYLLCQQGWQCRCHTVWLCCRQLATQIPGISTCSMP